MLVIMILLGTLMLSGCVNKQECRRYDLESGGFIIAPDGYDINNPPIKTVSIIVQENNDRVIDITRIECPEDKSIITNWEYRSK